MDKNSDFQEDSNTKQNNPRDYRFRVIGLVIGNIVGLVAMWLVAHQTTNWNDWAQVIAVWVLGLASLNVVIISALTTSEMIDTMRHQEFEMTEQRKATQETVKLTVRIVEEMKAQREQADRQLALAASQLTIARDQVVQMIGQGETMYGQLSVMKKQMDQNLELFSINLLPAIVVNSATLNVPISSGQFPVVELVMTNTGSSVANNVKLNNWRGSADPRLLEAIRQGIMPQKDPVEIGDTDGIFGPKIQYVSYIPAREWKDGELEGLLAKRRRFMVWGEVYYSDLLGNDYITQFCLSIQDDLNAQQLAFVTNYNKIVSVPKAPDPE
jgi:hypothetical protein